MQQSLTLRHVGLQHIQRHPLHVSRFVKQNPDWISPNFRRANEIFKPGSREVFKKKLY